MRTETVNIYKFHELDQSVKDRLIQEHRYDVLFYDWWDCVYREWIDKLDSIGFYDIDIKHSGFGCQVDGASFTAKYNIPEELKHYKDDYTIYIERKSSLYIHEYTCAVECDSSKDIPDDLAEYINRMEEKRVKWCQEIHQDLYDEFTYMTSNAQVKSYLNDNKYYKNGAMV